MHFCPLGCILLDHFLPHILSCSPIDFHVFILLLAFSVFLLPLFSSINEMVNVNSET